MYDQYFGFKERPFKLVPNPAYLYLSRSHEEALGHLKYAVHHGDGFVVISGQVGTGKTTLCRMFLESLENDVEAAYIFNPMMSAIELLRTINDEFGISMEGGVKELTDTLNEFLMKCRVEGKKVVLLIDEAQNLTTEVLEQLRLLSNLETATSKLIQIVLAGQPELSEKLEAYELRQLKQRITLNCQLVPLTRVETRAYIEHRLRVASANHNVAFTRGAYKDIYHYSTGIPRLINIVCDRALLTAFILEKRAVSAAIVQSAIEELSVGRVTERKAFPLGKVLIGVSAVCLILLLMVLLPVEKIWQHAKNVRHGSENNREIHHPIVAKPSTTSTTRTLPSKSASSAVRHQGAKPSIPIRKPSPKAVEKPKPVPVHQSASSKATMAPPPKMAAAARTASNEKPAASAWLNKERPEAPARGITTPASAETPASQAVTKPTIMPVQVAQKPSAAPAAKPAPAPVKTGATVDKTQPPASLQTASVDRKAVRKKKADKPTVKPKPKPKPTATPSLKTHVPVVKEELKLPAFMTLLRNLDTAESRKMAVTELIRLWKGKAVIPADLDKTENDRTYFRSAAKKNYLRMQILNTEIQKLKKIGLPAVLELYTPGGQTLGLPPRYLLLAGVTPQKLIFWDNGAYFSLMTSEINFFWTGKAYLLWNNLFKYNGVIPGSASASAIANLKTHLRRIGFKKVPTTAGFDDVTRRTIVGIQKKYGLKADGLVGPMTMMVLYSKLHDPRIPRLYQPSGDSVSTPTPSKKDGQPR